MHIDFESAKEIASNFVTKNPQVFKKKYEALNSGALIPNCALDSDVFWEFWFVQEDLKLSDVEYTKSLGVKLADVLTFVGRAPSRPLLKIRVSKASGSIKVLDINDH